MANGMSIDYEAYTKYGFGLGAALFVAGAIGATVGPTVFGELPSWEWTILFDAMVAGIVIGFVSVFGFGIALPLME